MLLTVRKEWKYQGKMIKCASGLENIQRLWNFKVVYYIPTTKQTLPNNKTVCNILKMCAGLIAQTDKY